MDRSDITYKLDRNIAHAEFFLKKNRPNDVKRKLQEILDIIDIETSGTKYVSRSQLEIYNKYIDKVSMMNNM